MAGQHPHQTLATKDADEIRHGIEAIEAPCRDKVLAAFLKHHANQDEHAAEHQRTCLAALEREIQQYGQGADESQMTELVTERDHRDILPDHSDPAAIREDDERDECRGEEDESETDQHDFPSGIVSPTGPGQIDSARSRRFHPGFIHKGCRHPVDTAWTECPRSL